MKRLFTLILSSFVVFLLTAQDVDLRIYKFPNAPVIDGIKDAQWEYVSKQNIDVQVEDDFGYASIIEAYFKMGWNDTALFVLVYRNDDEFANQWKIGLQDWMSDRDELYFDVNIDSLADGRGATFPGGASYGHYQFTSIWADSLNSDTVYWPQQFYHFAPYKFAYHFINERSYYSEYSIPFSSLKLNIDSVPDADSTPLLTSCSNIIIGFAISMVDVDMSDSPVDDTYRKYLRWSAADCDAWTNMDSAGRVEMGVLRECPIKISTDNNSLIRAIVYPNPVNNEISLTEDAETIAIYNISGQLLINKLNIKANESIDVSGLDSGVYFVRINHNEIGRFVK